MCDEAKMCKRKMREAENARGGKCVTRRSAQKSMRGLH